MQSPKDPHHVPSQTDEAADEGDWRAIQAAIADFEGDDLGIPLDEAIRMVLARHASN